MQKKEALYLITEDHRFIFEHFIFHRYQLSLTSDTTKFIFRSQSFNSFA